MFFLILFVSYSCRLSDLRNEIYNKIKEKKYIFNIDGSDANDGSEVFRRVKKKKQFLCHFKFQTPIINFKMIIKIFFSHYSSKLLLLLRPNNFQLVLIIIEISRLIFMEEFEFSAFIPQLVFDNIFVVTYPLLVFPFFQKKTNYIITFTAFAQPYLVEVCWLNGIV